MKVSDSPIKGGKWLLGRRISRRIALIFVALRASGHSLTPLMRPCRAIGNLGKSDSPGVAPPDSGFEKPVLGFLETSVRAFGYLPVTRVGLSETSAGKRSGFRIPSAIKRCPATGLMMRSSWIKLVGRR